MKITRFGLAAPELGWVPSPRYALRRQRVLRLLPVDAAGEALEIGCGAGALLYDLSTLGYRCTALETSDAAAALARAMNRDPPATVVSAPERHWAGRFDAILALEVLEHLEDDLASLARWATWLRPAVGRLLVSVPAHRRKWSASDEWVGHVRRYELDDLAAAIRGAGLELVHLESYGFPLANLTDRARALVARSRLARARQRGRVPTPSEATARSGIERRMETHLFRFMSTPPGRLIFAASDWLQGRFAHRDIGSGYLAVAKRHV